MTTLAPTKYEAAAADFVAEIEAHPILNRIWVRDTVVTITGEFTPGDTNAYVTCDATAESILALLPMTYPGTVWGTDGRSVGGHAGLTGGYFRLSKSGVGKRYARAVARAAREKGLA